MFIIVKKKPSISGCGPNIGTLGVGPVLFLSFGTSAKSNDPNETAEAGKIWESFLLLDDGTLACSANERCEVHFVTPLNYTKYRQL